jgi:thiamine kinase-like enzyme
LISKSRQIKGPDSIFLRDLTSEYGWFTALKQMREASGFATVEDPDIKGI